jgi:hypothetical protein
MGVRQPENTMTLNTLTLSIEHDEDGHAAICGQIKGWDNEIIEVGESGSLGYVKQAADYYVRNFENVKVVVELV